MFDVMATDAGGMSATTSVTISLVNVNDNRPQFNMNSYFATVTEVRGRGLR